MPILDLSNSEEVARYKEFVASSPYGHVMQSLNWAKVKNNWDSDYVYLCTEPQFLDSVILSDGG